MLGLRGEGTVKVSKVKGHADQATVDGSVVRNEVRIGKDGADTAADLGRLRHATQLFSYLGVG